MSLFNNPADGTDFSETNSLRGKFYIDEVHKLWYSPLENLINHPVHKFSEVISYELKENGSTVTKGGLGSAVIGGALFGGVGAVAGALVGRKTHDIIESLEIYVNLNNPDSPTAIIKLYPFGKVKRNSFEHKALVADAQKIISFLNIIIQSNNTGKSQSNLTFSVADEIKKYKELLDMGAITQTEFDEIKRTLLW